MKKGNSTTIILLITLLFYGVTYAQAGSNASPKAKKEMSLVGNPTGKIGDITWIAGEWQGEAFGGKAEEIWSLPTGSSMMGMFKLISDGEIMFYELMIIREVEQSLILQIKHFHSDLKGWEEKDETVDFPLVKMEHNKVWFDGLTFERLSPNKMIVNVIFDKDKPEGIDFVYTKE